VQRRVRDVDAHAQQQTTDLGQLRVFELLPDERALLQTPRRGCTVRSSGAGFQREQDGLETLVGECRDPLRTRCDAVSLVTST
jgi:hypothetical protein